MLLLALLAFAAKAAPYECRKGATHERGADEDPDILESLTADKERGTEGTGRVDGCAGQVDADEMDQDQGQTDGKTGEIAGAFLLIRRAEDDHNEDEGRDHFDEDTGPRTVDAREAVRAAHFEVADGADPGEDRRTDDTADELADPVAAGILPAHASRKDDTERDGRVDVATGDTADGIGHGDNRKTESNGRTDDSGRSAAAQEDGSAAAEQGQDRGTDTFSNVLFHKRLGF